MIVLWGLGNDPPLAAVHAALALRGAPVAVLDQRRVLHTEVELEVGDGVKGLVRAGGFTVDLAAVGAAYVRPHDAQRVPDVTDAFEDASERQTHALAMDDALLAWAEVTDGLVLNRPGDMAGNNSKLYQAAQVRTAGFAVPDTLVTTDPDAARSFAAEHDRVVYKSLSGVRSIVAELDPGDGERLADVEWCPTQFQAYVPGDDVRVHVVGERIFACEIRSDAVDYRYAARNGLAVDLVSSALPGDVAERCLTLAAATSLTLAGIDLRLTPSGEWFCFEVNPSPGFTYYEAATGQPIAEAIADLLATRATQWDG